MFSPVRHRVALAAAVAVCIAGQRAGAQSRGADEVERPEVERVTFRGVESVEEDELSDAVTVRASHCNGLLVKVLCLFSKSEAFYTREYLNRAELKRDVLRVKVFYYRRGYRDTQVDTSVTLTGSGRARVAFRITEGEPTRIADLRLSGADSLLTARDRKRLLHVHPNGPLDLLALDSTLVGLRTVLAERGYADAAVTESTTVDDSLRRAEVTIGIDPRRRNTVGAILIHGAQDVEERVIRNSLLMQEGDVFKPSELARSQRSLYESGLFRRASVDVVRTGRSLFRRDSVPAAPPRPEALDLTVPPPQTDSVKRITVNVEEAEPRAVRLSGGFNTADFLQAEARYTHNNFFGGGRRLDLQGVLGNILADQLNGNLFFRNVTDDFGLSESEENRFLAPTWQLSGDVRQRWFGSPRNTVGAGVFANRRSAPGVYIDRGSGASATFTREMAFQLPASASYRFEVTRVEAGDVYFCVNFGICEQVTINALRENQRLSPLALTATLNRANDPLNPSRGLVARLTAEHASALTASDFRYNRLSGSVAAYRPIRQRGVLAARLRLGIVGALAGTAEAIGIDAEGLPKRVLLHPRTRFYAGGSQSVRGYGENQLGPRVLTIPATTLRGDAANPKCTAADIAECDPNAVVNGDTLYEDRDFSPRPLGGTSLVEGNVEFRFPVWGPLVGAVFLDAAVVGATSLRDVTDVQGSIAEGITGAVTPGFGVRFISPVGPIRFDVGINPKLEERLTVITEGENGEIVSLTGPADPATGQRELSERTYNPAAGSGLGGFLNRATIHLSIGEAF
jgi:outer membrane protein assembly factor BamA